MNRINIEALSLPIYEKRAEIISALRGSQAVVVAGQTGSGKTTQLPLFCLEAGLGRRGKIGCTQPRRIAATSIAARVAAQIGCAVGGAVGYRIRFAAKESAETVIKFMTDGVLLAEAERDRNFSRYDTIIIDEAHERSLNIDFLLGYLRRLLPRRPDLKVIISSATIDAESFSKSFGGAPVIEVSGRLYPIEVLYRSQDNNDGIDDGEGGGNFDRGKSPANGGGRGDLDDDDGGYVGAAAAAVSDIIDEYGPGDMLVFMPTERDIRETCEKLRDTARRRDWSVLPLFSRLTRAEQEAIFTPSSDRTRIVVCTNIAETSITVPNIRYVVDTGLARVSRYAPRLRTSRLPIEPVSRASADQRMGRCGRVRDGVCVRLYSEDDYNGRYPFTQPEIKRSNLAGVILTMAAHNMGAIADFPFIEPPSKQAVIEGYAQLKELGALDKSKKLTPMGREMAKLPFDPHISRMIIAAKKENALREVKIIAAALSIVDPRERPFDRQAEADAMHAKFIDRSSDFMTYLRIWDACQNEWETHGGIRRFCKQHFLSYTRMREWHDVHRLIEETLKVNAECEAREAGLRPESKAPYGIYPKTFNAERGMRNAELNVNGSVNPFELPGKPVRSAPPDAVHRSLLTGLLANCAFLDKNGKYKAAGGKEVFIFPGSALAGKRCEWIMCHQIVETSRVFARTVAPIQPQWLEELAAEFCKHTFETPFFDTQTGAVRATERVTVFGLPLAVRQNSLYSKAMPEHAEEIFIWEGLVQEKLEDCYHPFYEHNKKIKEKVRLLEEKLRSRSYYSGDDAIYDFYEKALRSLPAGDKTPARVASVHDLNKAIKAAGGDKFLFMREEEILRAAIPPEAEHYPDHVSIGNQNFALKYAFEPGNKIDGVTLALPQKVLPFVEKEKLGWLLPALWPHRIKNLLRQLPRGQRKLFIPMNEAAERLAAGLDDSDGTFAQSLSKAIKSIYNIDIAPDLLEPNRADTHLDLKLEVRDDENNILAMGRSNEVFKQLRVDERENINIENNNSPWNEAFNSYKKFGLVKWPEVDFSNPVDIAPPQKGGLPVRGYPALISNGPDAGAPRGGSGQGVDLALFPSKQQAGDAHRLGVRQLLELTLSKDLAWTERELSFTNRMKVMASPFGKADDFTTKLYDMICGGLLYFDTAPVREDEFNKLAAKTKESLRGISFRLITIFEESLRLFADNTSRLSSAKNKLAPDIAKELSDTLNNFFKDILLDKITLDVFTQYPRYLRAFSVMIEKAASEPFKYRQKKTEVSQYISLYNNLKKNETPEHRQRLSRLHQMIMEYEISLFAQHIKTLYPVSPKRLDKVIEELRG